MRVPREWVEAYGAALNVTTEEGADALERALAQIRWNQAVAEVREQLISAMQLCCGATATVAARVAADFYDGLRARCGVEGDGFRAQVDPCREPEATEGAVRAFVQDLAEGKPAEGVAARCRERLDYEARLAANMCVERNARRDPAKPRWARVPTGDETCEFCVMLASRGFVYHGAELASHAHANCDCRVVPGWGESPAVEGYDPDAYYRAWRKLGEIDARKDLGLGEKEMLRLAIADTLHPLGLTDSRKLSEAMDTCVARRVSKSRVDKANKMLYDQQVNGLLADIGEVYGINLRAEYLFGPRLDRADPKRGELWAVTRLSGIARDILFCGSNYDHKNPDVKLDGLYADIKTPTQLSKLGKHLMKAKRQCEAAGQADGHAVISNLYYKEDFNGAIALAKEFVDRGTLKEVHVVGVGFSAWAIN